MGQGASLVAANRAPRAAWVALVVAARLAPSLVALEEPRLPSLPDFDQRMTSPPARAELPPRRAAGVARLVKWLPDAKVDSDLITGAPKLVSSRRGYLTGPSGSGPSVAKASLSLSQEAWTNAGSVTWPSALQTFMWAVRGGDYSTLKELAWSTPDQRFEKHTGLLTDLVSRSQAIRFGVPKYTRADGLDTLNADWATTVHIDVMFDQGANEAPRFHEVKFTRLGDGWKCSF
jgi:hypothetical protein